MTSPEKGRSEPSSSSMNILDRRVPIGYICCGGGLLLDFFFLLGGADFPLLLPFLFTGGAAAEESSPLDALQLLSEAADDDIEPSDVVEPGKDSDFFAASDFLVILRLALGLPPLESAVVPPDMLNGLLLYLLPAVLE